MALDLRGIGEFHFILVCIGLLLCGLAHTALAEVQKASVVGTLCICSRPVHASTCLPMTRSRPSNCSATLAGFCDNEASGVTFRSELTSDSKSLMHIGARIVWIATASNEGYLRMRWWQDAVQNSTYRKELVAGGLAGYATSEFKRAAERVGDQDTDWREVEEQARAVRPPHS